MSNAIPVAVDFHSLALSRSPHLGPPCLDHGLTVLSCYMNYEEAQPSPSVQLMAAAGLSGVGCTLVATPTGRMAAAHRAATPAIADLLACPRSMRGARRHNQDSCGPLTYVSHGGAGVGSPAIGDSTSDIFCLLFNVPSDNWHYPPRPFCRFGSLLLVVSHCVAGAGSSGLALEGPPFC